MGIFSLNTIFVELTKEVDLLCTKSLSKIIEIQRGDMQSVVTDKEESTFNFISQSSC